VLPALRTAIDVRFVTWPRSALPAEERFIDWHPEYDNVLIAGGGSGHATHGPVLGEYVASRTVGEQPPGV
jgi:glycine/D-amino acid oxidase-like deaminating enzyme